MHRAIGLLIQVGMAVHIALPLGTWRLLSDRRDDAKRPWFVSISSDPSHYSHWCRTTCHLCWRALAHVPFDC
jgi:hypothetical protein